MAVRFLIAVASRGSVAFTRNGENCRVFPLISLPFPVVQAMVKSLKYAVKNFCGPDASSAARRVHEVGKKPGQAEQPSFLTRDRGVLGQFRGWLPNERVEQPGQTSGLACRFDSTYPEQYVWSKLQMTFPRLVDLLYVPASTLIEAHVASRRRNSEAIASPSFCPNFRDNCQSHLPREPADLLAQVFAGHGGPPHCPAEFYDVQQDDRRVRRPNARPCGRDPGTNRRARNPSRLRWFRSMDRTSRRRDFPCY